MQVSFDPLNYDCFNADPKDAHRRAQIERNAAKARLKSQGKLNVRGWRLTGQLKKYASFGVEDGRVRTVYYVSYDEPRSSFDIEESDPVHSHPFNHNLVR